MFDSFSLFHISRLQIKNEFLSFPQEKGSKKSHQKSTFDTCPQGKKKKTWQLSAPRNDVGHEKKKEEKRMNNSK
tara:strand:- start:642 stop:863 length:222 start_codon:yes stop_codon:yes gene_type:complete